MKVDCDDFADASSSLLRNEPPSDPLTLDGQVEGSKELRSERPRSLSQSGKKRKASPSPFNASGEKGADISYVEMAENPAKKSTDASRLKLFAEEAMQRSQDARSVSSEPDYVRLEDMVAQGFRIKRSRSRPPTTGDYVGLAKAKRDLVQAEREELHMMAERDLIQHWTDPAVTHAR